MAGIEVLVQRCRPYEIADHHADRVDRRPAKLFIHGMRGIHKALGSSESDVKRRARRQVNIGLDVIADICRPVEDEQADIVGAKQRQRKNDKQDSAYQRNSSVSYGPGNRRHHNLVAELVQPAADPALEYAQRRNAPAALVRQVSGQDKESFNQRHRKDESRHVGEYGNHLVEACGDEQERKKSKQRRQYPDGDRPDYGMRAGNGCIQGVFAALPFRGNTLSNHHRIVYDNADQQEKPEDGSHVQRHVRGPEEHQRADHGQRDTDGYPYCHAQVEHHDQADEYQHDTECGIPDNLRYPVNRRLRPVVPDRDGYRWRSIIVRKPTLDLLAHRND